MLFKVNVVLFTFDALAGGIIDLWKSVVITVKVEIGGTATQIELREVADKRRLYLVQIGMLFKVNVVLFTFDDLAGGIIALWKSVVITVKVEIGDDTTPIELREVVDEETVISTSEYKNPSLKALSSLEIEIRELWVS
jgi:hypothetical protein